MLVIETNKEIGGSIEAGPLSREKVMAILAGIQGLKAGIIGDSCLDIYWQIDMTRSELSRETPHYTLPVVGESFTPGAAANTAVNLKKLGCSEVKLCSIIADDWRGRILREKLEESGISCEHVVLSKEGSTPAYCKPILHGLQDTVQEAPRIDFIHASSWPESIVGQVIDAVDAMAAQVDVIGVTDQLVGGVVGDAVRRRLSHWAERGKLVVADSREHIGSFSGCIVKPNEVEAPRSVGMVMPDENAPLEEWMEIGRRLSSQVSAPCCLTMGSRGAIWIEEGTATAVPTLPVKPPLDVVGAGDCFGASLMSALGVGASGAEAVAFAHLGAAVSVKKLGGVGHASPEEIMERYDECVK